MNISKGRYWDASWNPVTGCTPSGPACDHCWAAGIVKRFPELHGVHELDPDSFEGAIPEPYQFGEPVIHYDRFAVPEAWRKPRVIATCWLGDLFHEKVLWQWIARVVDAIIESPRHQYLLLTKRPGLMMSWLYDCFHQLMDPDDSDLVAGAAWWGVSAWDDDTTHAAVDSLMSAPTGHRWLSLEPLLAPVTILDTSCELSQVIVGAETGPGARPLDLDWVRRIRDDCREASIPFFLKSLGARCGRELDGRTHDDLAWAVARG